MNPVVVLALFILSANVLVLAHILLVEWRWRRAQNYARARLKDTRWIGKGW